VRQSLTQNTAGQLALLERGTGDIPPLLSDVGVDPGCSPSLDPV